jgi:hypothetical protein
MPTLAHMPAERADRSCISGAKQSLPPDGEPVARLGFASVNTLLARPVRRDRRPPSVEPEPPAPPAASSPAVVTVPDREEAEMVVYRTGKADRMLSAPGSGADERPATITDPVARGYPGLADVTAQELTAPR